MKAIGDDVATRFGFESDAKELVDHEIDANGRWVVAGAYSNRDRGLREISGGYSHVDFFIFAQPAKNDIEITIRDYGNAEESDYVRALKVALTDGFRAVGILASAAWQSRVVHTLEP